MHPLDEGKGFAGMTSMFDTRPGDTYTRTTKTNDKLYWPREMDTHIKQWLWHPQHGRRDAYFNTNIYPALFKLVSTYSHFSAYNAKHDLQYKRDCFEFVMNNVITAMASDKWNADRGVPSFSFFNICTQNAAKMYYTMHAKQRHREKLVVSVDPIERAPGATKNEHANNRSEHTLMREYSTKQAEAMKPSDWYVDTLALLAQVVDDRHVKSDARLIAATLKHELTEIDPKGQKCRLVLADAVRHIITLDVIPGADKWYITQLLRDVVAHVEERRTADDTLHVRAKAKTLDAAIARAKKRSNRIK